MKIKKTKAFTLAEILIVLGIIGIVAALTIPTLMTKVQNHEYVVALKKFYTTQTDGWERVLADEGVNSLDDTSLFQSMGSIASCRTYQFGEFAVPECTTFFNNLGKYFKFNGTKISDDYSIKRLDGPASSVFTKNGLMTPDGMIIFATYLQDSSSYGNGITPDIIKKNGGHLTLYIADIVVDVNGLKKPNTFGRDAFEFLLSNDGKLYPEFGKDDSIFKLGDSEIYWKVNPVAACGSGRNVSDSWGFGCAARIMDEGWEMNY